MKLKKFKEKDNKQIGIIVFTIACILLVSGVILYRTFAIFEVKTNQNIINGNVQSMGDLRFMVYVEGELQKDMPNKNSEYSLDTSKSYCEDITDSSKRSHINWNQEKWSIEIKDVGTTKTKCYLYFDKLYVDSTLNGAIPDLGNELVAITFDDTGHALKADLTKEWYDYSNQKWANAVILMSKEDYEVNEEIPEENIESYFVWIPRYEYQIWNGEEKTNNFFDLTDLGVVEDTTQKKELNQQQAINIRFVNKNNPIITGSIENSWLTHSAFTSFDSNGFWVGKFETGYNQNIDITNLQTTDWNVSAATVNSLASDRVVIKPNVYSWRGIDTANAFYTAYNYRRGLESHMMKNMEWGAIAYLTNSNYGRCKDNHCEKVRFNNSYFVTGYSANFNPTCGYTQSIELCNHTEIVGINTDGNYGYNYNNSASVASSTTNNYYGIYDMSGGAHEIVMGVMLSSDNSSSPSSGKNKLFNSGFRGPYSKPESDNQNESENKEGKAWPDKKYYDLYNFSTSGLQYQLGILGDGTKEFGPFYTAKYNNDMSWMQSISSSFAEGAYFLYDETPWFIRGGSWDVGSEMGVSYFSGSYGSAGTNTSFRIVLTP